MLRVGLQVLLLLLPLPGMPSNLGIKRAPFLVLGNFIRNLGLEKGKKGPLKGLVGFRLRALGLRV